MDIIKKKKKQDYLLNVNTYYINMPEENYVQKKCKNSKLKIQFKED